MDDDVTVDGMVPENLARYVGGWEAESVVDRGVGEPGEPKSAKRQQGDAEFENDRDQSRLHNRAYQITPDPPASAVGLNRFAVGSIHWKVGPGKFGADAGNPAVSMRVAYCSTWNDDIGRITARAPPSCYDYLGKGAER